MKYKLRPVGGVDAACGDGQRTHQVGPDAAPGRRCRVVFPSVATGFLAEMAKWQVRHCEERGWARKQFLRGTGSGVRSHLPPAFHCTAGRTAVYDGVVEQRTWLALLSFVVTGCIRSDEV